jgi:hypothetical protein
MNVVFKAAKPLLTTSGCKPVKPRESISNRLMGKQRAEFLLKRPFMRE